MLFTHLILLVSISTLSHAAAHDIVEKPLDEITIDDLVGVSCNERGKCKYVTALNKQGKNPSCSITFAYTEHPDLKAPDILLHIAQTLHQKRNLRDSENFSALCKEEIGHYIDPAANDDQAINNPPHILVALSIELGIERMKSVGCDFFDIAKSPSLSQHSNFLWSKLDDKKRPVRLHACYEFPVFTSDPIESPQEDADKLHVTDPDKRFHLLIDLAVWYRIIKSEYKKLKQAREQNQKDLTANAFAQCLQQ